jgi:hypothetical protein
MHWRRVQKISITLANLEEFLVISLFHEMKIPMVDMKVQAYSKFRKNKIWKKVKSPISMRNGRFNTSKCRGKLQKMGVMYTHSPKMPGSSSKLPQKNKKIIFFGMGLDSIGGAGRGPPLFYNCLLPPAFLLLPPHFFPHVVNSSWLQYMPAQPNPTQKLQTPMTFNS